jgi:hypothetical protein
LYTTKYGKEFSDIDVKKYLSKIKNDVFKLLPLREEGAEWQKHLNTILIELSGFNSLIDEVKIISILSKLESLYELADFMEYRKTIFEILNLLTGLR